MSEKQKFTVNEIIDFVTNDDEDLDVDSDEEQELILLPPIERPEADTDCDSDASDDENEGLVHHLPARLLSAPCSTNMLDNSIEKSGDELDEDKSTAEPPPTKKQKGKKCEKK